MSAQLYLVLYNSIIPQRNPAKRGYFFPAMPNFGQKKTAAHLYSSTKTIPLTIDLFFSSKIQFSHIVACTIKDSINKYFIFTA